LFDINQQQKTAQEVLGFDHWHQKTKRTRAKGANGLFDPLASKKKNLRKRCQSIV